jgi:hypothetical protein
VVECLMRPHHGKRRLPVEHRGRRVPNLYRRPKSPADARNGDTFEVICRDETGRQRLKTLQARTVQRAVAEAEEYRTQIRRGELTPRSRVTVSEVAHELFGITESMRSSVRCVSLTIETPPFAASRRSCRCVAPWTMRRSGSRGSKTFGQVQCAFPIRASHEKPRQIARREPRRLSDEEIRRLCAGATPRYGAVVTTLA